MSRVTYRAALIWAQTSWKSGRWPYMLGPARRRPVGPAGVRP